MPKWEWNGNKGRKDIKEKEKERERNKGLGKEKKKIRNEEKEQGKDTMRENSISNKGRVEKMELKRGDIFNNSRW